ncbi:hypothetical protein ACFY1L_46485 [Streptomyces sp. NPDC001663]|uniref:hypothetical protein n=1 Tax=Streptomyces sp. NPDC001663 TaxID=3364597 RepID=UPI0036CBF4D0
MPPSYTETASALGGSRWNTFPEASTMTAREFFDGTLPLLQGIIDDNALTSADGEVLRAQIRATLGLGTRETSLPLAVGPDSATAARELGSQAEAIGEAIASWATAALDRLLTERIAFPAGPLVVRSHCYGHLLTPAAADLLLGRRGGPVTMQLYNEWLHQTVLLRDALLPFTNWRGVPLLVTPSGLRHTEAARDRFLTELLVRQIRHTSIVGFARHVVTGTSGPDGYGFDADGGTVLPAVIDSPPFTAPRHLLTWRPDHAVDETATYVAEESDYYAAPRTLVEDLPPAGTTQGPLIGRIVADRAVDGIRTAHIEVSHDDTTARVDLGQALRGHRFAHRQDHTADAETAEDARTAAVWSALRAPALVWTQGGEVAWDAVGQDPIVVLALLGRLYPENVVLRSAGHRTSLTTARSKGPGRLVINVSDHEGVHRQDSPATTK